ncbi:hypothetical protein [Chitinolyticbacter albus]|uniref:hypothetical protein n=1 Tax=Chitinolyticbacter albus TaxID=2961951 RepID=UPI00210E02CD|nr:hypothetical protein [Chitinolyticbacter albus]
MRTFLCLMLVAYVLTAVFGTASVHNCRHEKPRVRLLSADEVALGEEPTHWVEGMPLAIHVPHSSESALLPIAPFLIVARWSYWDNPEGAGSGEKLYFWYGWGLIELGKRSGAIS